MDHFTHSTMQKSRHARTLFTRFLFAWLVVGAVAVTDHMWVSIGGFTVSGGLILAASTIAVNLLCIAGVLLGIARFTRYDRMTKLFRFREVAHTMAWFSLLSVFIPAFVLLTYLCVTVRAPLVDDSLIRFGGALGFHWLAFYQWVHAHPNFQGVLSFAYRSVALQLPVVLIVLGMTGRYDDLSEFSLLFLISGISVAAIATVFPASSAFLHFGIVDPFTSSTVSDFNLLRSGVLTTFEPSQGMISLPSFHTVLGILYTYALRRVKLLFPVAIALNAIMILSTLTQGGHYLADLLAGLAVAGTAILITRKSLSARTKPAPIEKFEGISAQ